MMKILITAEYDKRYVDRLSKDYGEVVYRPWTEKGRGLKEDEVLDLLEKLKPDVYITELDVVNGTVLRDNPQLKVVGDCRANPTNIDVEAAKEFGIPILTTPGRNAQAVAEMLVGALLAQMRNIVDAVNWVKEGLWNKPAPESYFRFKGNELGGKCVGFVGFGAVGRKIAEMLLGFGCEIMYYDPYVDLDDERLHKSKIEEVFSVCDVVSINLPVLDETIGMVDRRLIGMMKSSAIFVNTARSAVVDMDFLYESLYERKIAGAVLDVFEHEPPLEAEKMFFDLGNVLATPHIAGATFEVVEHQSDKMNRMLKDMLDNKEEKGEKDE